MTDGVRVALIGTGKIAELGHLPGFVKAQAEIAALCNTSSESLNRLADQYGVERRYNSWRQMIADGGFDAVSICTPPAYHREMTVECLEQGYHTLVEKPMAVTLQECRDMIDAAQAANRLLMLAHNQRFRVQHTIVKEILTSGRLGAVWRVHTVFAHGGPEYWSPGQKWYFDPILAGQGVLLDLGYHKIDLLRWLLGQEIVHIQALVRTFEKPTAAEDTAVAIMKFSEGTLGTLQVSWAHRPDVSDSLVADCERGTLTVPSDPIERVRMLEKSRSGAMIESTFRCNTTDGPGWSGMAGAFVEVVRNGEPSPVPGSEGLAALDAILRAYASAGIEA
jgi:UDP-N-acetylglucosamine 3-dehydrogenase